MITSGDVLLRFRARPAALSPVDVLGLGMRVPADHAKDFGVFFCPRQRPGELAFFLQKPAPAGSANWPRVTCITWTRACGCWSERAVQALMRQCGWNGSAFPDLGAATYEFYAQFALGLGTNPAQRDPATDGLTSGVVLFARGGVLSLRRQPPDDPSVCALPEPHASTRRDKFGRRAEQADQVNQNSRFGVAVRRDENASLWIENSAIPAGWHLASERVLTGMPETIGTCASSARVCAWMSRGCSGRSACAPTGSTTRSAAGLGKRPRAGWGRCPAADWLPPTSSRWKPAASIRRRNPDLPVIPGNNSGQIQAGFVHWLFAAAPRGSPEIWRPYRALPRLSARELNGQTNVERVYAQRRGSAGIPSPHTQDLRWSVFFRLDLESTGRAFAATSIRCQQYVTALFLLIYWFQLRIAISLSITTKHCSSGMHC